MDLRPVIDVLAGRLGITGSNGKPAHLSESADCSPTAWSPRPERCGNPLFGKEQKR
jgi:hypothetical protein